MIAVLPDAQALRAFGSFSGAQWCLRSVIVAAAILCLTAVGFADPDSVGWFWIVVVMVASVWTFFVPDSTGAAIVIAALGVCWWTRVDSAVSGWLLVFVVGTLVIHVAAALASTGPPAARIGIETLTRWTLSSMLVALIGSAGWLVHLLLDDVAVPASSARLVAVLIALAVLVWWIRALSLDDSAQAADVTRRDYRP